MLHSVFSTIALLGTDQRRRLFALAGLTLIGAVLEVIGIGLVLPLMLLLVGHTPSGELPVAGGWLAGILPTHDGPGAATVLLALLLGVFTTKNLFLAWLAARQMNFAGTTQEALSQRLFALYLRQPYSFHLHRNSSELLRNAVIEVDELTGKAIIPLLTLIVEGLICLAVTGILLVLEPVGAVAGIVVVAGAGWILYALSQRPLRRWGERRQHHEGQRLRQFQHGLRMVKEIKLLGREEALFTWFRRHGGERAQAVERYETLQRLPRLWFEVLFVASMAAVTAVLLARGTPRETIVPVLGVFAAAALRLIPSVSRVLASVQALANARPVADLLHRELTELGHHADPTAPDDAELRLRHTLSVEGVGFRYAADAVPILHGITLTIARGERVCITGSSGAGKSTLLDLVLGLLPPSTGRVRVDGRDINEAPRSWQRQIGYVTQSIGLIDDSLRCNVALGVPEADIDDEAVGRALHEAGLDRFAESLPGGLDTAVGENGIRLSGGQRQRLGIARALYHRPEVLVLDEPTSALDLGTETEILGRLLDPAAGRTVLMAAHRPTAIAMCDRVIHLDAGRVVDDRVLTGAARATR